MTIFKRKYEEDRSFNGLNKFAYFVDFWHPLFVDLLFDLPQLDYEREKSKFIEQCRIYYRANETMLLHIDEFERTYEAQFAVQWYKRNSFIYRLLNRVMRQENLRGILAIRFFILDICKQLHEIYQNYTEAVYLDNSSFVVYRGIKLAKNDFVNMKKDLSPSTILSINTLFSTSQTLEVALVYAGAIDSKSKTEIISSTTASILFEITININHQMSIERKPYANISFERDEGELKYRDECEVLCMVGSFLRVDEIQEDYVAMNAKVTLIKLTLINENDSTIPIMKDYQILKSTETIEGKIIRIGNLLIDRSLAMCSPRSKAESFYRTLTNEFNSMYLSSCLTGQAWIAFKREQFDLAISLVSEALSKGDQSNAEWKITTLNCIGGVYFKQKRYIEALKYYKQAYHISEVTDEKIANNSYHGPCIPIDKFAMYDNYRNISSINIARIYQCKGESDQAWKMYKEIVDSEMRDASDFHCHTCMTIAESGTHVSNPSREERYQIWRNWKNFLDLGLDDMLKYRTSIITGYFSFNHQYDFLSTR
ncbi:unnamed protein product, partial [Adineta ricciae]